MCWEHPVNSFEFTNDTFTMVISGTLFTVSLPSENKVCKMQSAGNQRLCKSSLVGTSETTCVTTKTMKKNGNTNNDIAFKEWFAGMIDGDGCFLVNKKGIMNVVNMVNGYIQHSIRKSQLHRVCSVMNIPIQDTVNLTKNSHWFARIL